MIIENETAPSPDTVRRQPDGRGRHAAVPPPPQLVAYGDLLPQPADSAVVDEVPDTGRLFSWRKVLGYFTPPAPWVTPPASLDELACYAHVGEWAAPRGLRRSVGIAYWYVLGLPFTVACRYLEWIVQRPGRLLTVLLIAAVLYRSTPGHWVAHAIGRLLQIVFYPLTWLF